MYSVRLLIRPAIFTAGVCGTCFCGAAIVQQGRQRTDKDSNFSPERRTPPPKTGWVREQMKQDWSEQAKSSWTQFKSEIIRLTQETTTNQKIGGCFILLNLAVFCAWRVKPLAPIMNRYFVLRITPTKIPLSNMILSSFSHSSSIRLMINMTAIYAFSGTSNQLLGPEQLVGFFLSCGAVAAFAHIVHGLLVKQYILGLGASGGLLGLLAYTSTVRPDLNVSFHFFTPINIRDVLIGLMLFDMVGLIAQWKMIGHAAHLSGALFGICYAKYGEDLFYRHNQTIVDKWLKLKKHLS